MKKIYSFILVIMAAAVAAPMFTSCSEKTEGGEQTEVNTDALEAELQACQELLDNATTSDYPEEAIADFEEIVTTINETLAGGGLNQTAVDNMLVQLQEAKETFLGKGYGAIPSDAVLLSYDFETEANPQVSAGSLKYEAALTAGPSEIFNTDTQLPTFVEGVNGGKAISFANGSHLEIANWSQSALLGNEISISVWVKPTAIVPGNYIFSINYWNTLKFNIQELGKPFLTINVDGTGADCDNQRDQSVKANEWTHLVVTVSLASDEMKFYVNGEPTMTWTADDKPALSGNAWSVYSKTLPIMIGTTTTYEETSSWDWEWEHSAEYWNNNVGFNGAIDNFRVYNIALTDGQVSGLYTSEGGQQE